MSKPLRKRCTKLSAQRGKLFTFPPDGFCLPRTTTGDEPAGTVFLQGKLMMLKDHAHMQHQTQLAYELFSKSSCACALEHLNFDKPVKPALI